MTDPRDRAQSVFLDALEIASEAERAAYIEAECAGDDGLRNEVEELLDQCRVLCIVDGIVFKTALGEHFFKYEFEDGRTVCWLYFYVCHLIRFSTRKFTKVFLLTFDSSVKNVLKYDTQILVGKDSRIRL